MSGTDIIILSFKLKFYGTNSITGSTSSRVTVQLDGSDIFSGQKGVVSVPAGQQDYNASEWKTYNIILTGGTSTSKITFRGTSSNYAYMIDDVVVTKASMPSVATTTPPSVINFTNATLGGTITATGLPITESGIVWSTTNTDPTVADTKVATDPLVVSGAISANITGLTAGGTYYYNTYVITPAGTVYGTASSFTTPIPDYKLTSSPIPLDFGTVTINTSSVLAYSVSGKELSPASGNITVTAPAGFTISTASNGTFTSSLDLPYTSSTLASTTIYVKYSPIVPFVTESGTISLSGGGVTSDFIINQTVSGSGKLVAPANASNVGNDFWLGFGYHTSMSNSNPSSSSAANLSLYISAADKDATIIVEIPGMGGAFTPIEVFVPAGTVQEVTGFPIAGAKNPGNELDSRLYFTGITNRAIHVYSKDGTPVSVWMYTYSSDNSAAGSMVFPTNTWNNSYSVQAYGNNTNSGVPNSFFFVIAEEDNTEIEITPTVDILSDATTNIFAVTDGSPAPIVAYPAGVPFTITLNRGQVFNAMSSFSGNVGLDLSGTTVKSTNCKKIAVFGGNGRVLVDVGDGAVPPKFGSTGSDNLIQQMFPKVAWGTKYYTTPTKHMEFNRFRISIDDPSTQVWVNDPTRTPANALTNLTNGYYQYDSNQPLIIESDKPISVTQFIAAQGYATGKSGAGPSEYGMNGIGDPEMIILSPAQQAINKVTVYSPSFKNGKTPAGAYINVVIPKSGLNSFKLDLTTNPDQLVDTGASSYDGVALDPAAALIPIIDAFKPYANDANYYFAKFKVDFPNAHTLTSDVAFNAIAYGTNDGESYGFNAGTQVNDLTAPLILNNPFGDSLNSLNSSKPLTTCKGTEVAFSATLPFPNVDGKEIVFSYGNNPNITPNLNDTIKNPVLSNTFEFNGKTYYVYKLAQKHIYNENGDYSVDVQFFDPSPTNSCGNEEGTVKSISYPVKVRDGVVADFDMVYNTCINNTVTVTDKSTTSAGFEVVAWNWSTSGNTPLPVDQATVKNPVFTNPANNTTLTLKAINSIGCFKDATKTLPVTILPNVTFSALPTGICNSGASFQLTQASPAGGVYSGPGVTNVEGSYFFNPGATAVSTSQPNTITYTYTAANSCVDIKTQTISISRSETPVITAVAPLCINANAVNLAGTPTGGTWSGPGVSGATFNPTTAGVGNHIVTYSLGGTCSTPQTTTIVVNPLPTVSIEPITTTVPQNSQITLNASAPQGSTFLWSSLNSASLLSYLSSTTVEDPILRPATIGIVQYQVEATLLGCKNTADISVEVTGKCLDPMKGFTPNRDGYNDKWQVFAAEGCFTNVKVDVYNRWGALVYNNDRYDNSWQGEFKGKNLPDGTYYYIIRAKDGSGRTQTLTGNVTIIR